MAKGCRWHARKTGCLACGRQDSGSSLPHQVVSVTKIPADASCICGDSMTLYRTSRRKPRMNAGTILSSLVDGLLIGVVYGIAAMGLNLIWGVMRVINLAHGALISLGMFGVYLFFSSLGLNPYLALILVAILGLLAGILIYQIAIRRVIDAPYLSTLLATFSINMIIIG